MTKDNPVSQVGASQLDPRMVAGLRELQRESGTEVLLPLVEMYLRNTPERLEHLKTAIAAGDAHALQQVAHAIRGSSASFGASRLAALCQALEDLGRQASLARAAAYLAEVAAEYQRVAVALRDEFGAPPANERSSSDPGH